MMKHDCKRTQMNNIFCFGLKHSNLGNCELVLQLPRLLSNIEPIFISFIFYI